MTTPHDPHRDDGLSEDARAFERALAARLQRAGGPREPSAALDAAILAAARAAVGDATVAPAAPTPGTAAEGPQAADPPPHAPHPPSDPSAGHGSVVALPPRKPGPRTPRPRWPLGLSLAASLVLAAGIGFKLYDGNLSHDTAESAVAADAYQQQASETVTEAILIDPPLQREPPPPPPPLADAAAQAKVQARRESAELAPTRPRSAAADAAADAMSAAPQEAPVPSAPPRSSPPPAPVAARRPDPVQPIEAEQQALDRVEVTGTRVDGARSVGAAEHTRTPLNERRREASEAARAAEAQRETARAESLRRQDSAERRAVVAPPPPPPPMAAPAPAPPSAAARSNAGSGFAADPSADKADAEAEDAAGLYDDRPPVSADSPEFRQAWLQRIRKLLADGRRPQAKESLLEYSRRYPEAVIPEDLRPLLAPEPPPPAP